MLIVVGLYRVFIGDLGADQPGDHQRGSRRRCRRAAGSLSLLMLLRAFSSGAVALSGVEAVTNGVPAFKKPESKNAAHTLMWMAVILGIVLPRRVRAGLQPQADPRRPTTPPASP